MPTTPVDRGSAVRAAVRGWLDRLGLGLYGVACSGGADSVALADAVIEEAGATHVVVVTIDHGLSPHSAQVAEQVAAWARDRGAGVLVRRVEVAREASLEAAARTARYAALDAAADELGVEWMLLGHTARDQAETVLMRIVRGTGPAGLAAIPAMRGRFVRPLLELDRAAIDRYVIARRLPTWADPMNEDPKIARVRFREHLMPLLRAENPALDDALVRLATTAREWLAVIDELCEPFARFPIDCHALALQPAAIRKRALALALEAAGLGYDASHLDALDRLVARTSQGEIAIDIPGATIVRSYQHLDVRRPTHAGSRAVVPAGYELRAWRAGDRMNPARLKGRSRKLSDLYIDAKIPRELRVSARVLVRSSDHVIVWAEHLGIAFGESNDLVPVPA